MPYVPGMGDRTDTELISLGQAGDSVAIGELFSRHYQHSMRIAKRILPSTEDSEDAVQDACCSVLKNIHSFRGDASFRTWLTRIVVNSCRMSYRQPSRRLLTLDDDAIEALANETGQTSAQSPETCASQREVAATLHSVIARLPPELHRPYTLFSYSEMPVAEVAATLGLTLPAAKTRIYRARGVLRTALSRTWKLARPISPDAGLQPIVRTATHARHSSPQRKSDRRRPDPVRSVTTRLAARI